ncbi:MAG: macro domain-containing protein [Pseudomonadota bacterium]
MTTERTINKTKIRLVRDDITTLEIQAFVYYAQHNLKLGSGFGGAIAQRGGPKIEEELSSVGRLETGQATISSAGELKAEYIVHAVGPRFQEPDIEGKLHRTIIDVLQRAEKKGIKHIAFPPMGCGFYGIPLVVSADVTLETFKEYLNGNTQLEEIVVCVTDNRELPFFESKLEKLT